MMPMLDGFGLLRELRADPATATIPILLVSARAGEEARVEGLERGADDYLTKPFGARELLARVAAHIELARVRRAAARRERELRDEAESILESITDGFLALDRDWRITYMNAEAERINGRPREEMLGRDHWELFPATVGTRLEREFRRAVAEQVSVQFENHYEPWGRWFEVKAYPSRDGGLAVYFRDVTERKHGLQHGAAAGRAERHVRLVARLPGNAPAVAGLAVPVLADLCVFDVVGRDGVLQRVAWACAGGGGRGPARARSPDSSRRRGPATTRRPACWRPAGPSMVAEVTDDWLRSAALDREHLEFLRGLRIASAIIVPIAAREKVLGVLTLCYLDRSGRRYDDDDRRVAEELAPRPGWPSTTPRCTRAPGRPRRGRGRQPDEGRVPGHPLARAADPAERHRRLVAAAPIGQARRPRTSSRASTPSTATPRSRPSSSRTCSTSRGSSPARCGWTSSA